MRIYLSKVIKVGSCVILLGLNERFFSIVKERVLYQDRRGRQYFTFQKTRYYLDEMHQYNIKFEERNEEDLLCI